jgi:hypothetical protein
MSKPATTKPEGKVKIVDTYIRAIEKLAALTPQIDALEAEVRDREVAVLEKILELLRPVLPRLVGPIVLKEPWADGSARSSPKSLKERGVVVARTFADHRESTGAQIHRSNLVVVNEHGKLLTVDETARWTEPARTDVFWNIETQEIRLTPEFAAEHLREVLAGLLDALRERLSRDLEDKRDLKDRIARLEEAEKALGE